MESVTTMLRTIEDKKELYKLVAYLTMGDGGVYYSGNNCRFMMNILERNLDFAEYAKNILENVTSVSIHKNVDNREGRQPTVRVATKAHPLFTQMREHIYTDHYKGISPHYLKLLDWEALAILFMSDGSLYVANSENTSKSLVNPSYSVSLNMKRLSYGDQVILRDALEEKLGLVWNINRAGKYYALRLRAKSVQHFYENIADYILPSFWYKVPLIYLNVM